MALAFRPRLDRVDEILLDRVQSTGSPTGDLETALGLPAISLFDLFPPQEWLPKHYGKVAHSLWVLVDQVFKAADSPNDSPPQSEAKAVQVADIYEVPPTVNSRTAFLS